MKIEIENDSRMFAVYELDGITMYIKAITKFHDEASLLAKALHEKNQ